MDGVFFFGILKDLFFVSQNAQWGWSTYLQNWVVFGVNVGKYAVFCEHLGMKGARVPAVCALAFFLFKLIFEHGVKEQIRRLL